MSEGVNVTAGKDFTEIKAHMKRLSLASSKLRTDTATTATGTGTGAGAGTGMAAANATYPITSTTTSELQERVAKLKRHILERNN